MGKIQCDVCGGTVVMQAGGKTAACEKCGMVYSIERVRELMQPARPSVPVQQPAVQGQRKPSMDVRNGVLVSYTGFADSVVIPGSVREIGKEAFYGSGVRSVVLSDGVTKIGESAFYACRYLTSVQLPSSLRTIGTAAFEDCVSLPSIDIPQGVTEIGGFAFSNCRSLASVSVPDSVRKLHVQVFAKCENLKKADMPKRLWQDLVLNPGMEAQPWVRQKRQELGVCQHCGGKLSGLFSKRCTRCGKPKDY